MLALCYGLLLTLTLALAVSPPEAEVYRTGVVFLTFHDPATTTNAVTGEVRDRITECPEYKLTPVEVEPEMKE